MDKEELIKTGAVAAGGGFLFILRKFFSRKKDKDNFWKIRFEGAKEVVKFWEDEGKRLVANMEALNKQYIDLSRKYDELNVKYGIILSENLKLQGEVGHLRDELKTFKSGNI